MKRRGDNGGGVFYWSQATEEILQAQIWRQRFLALGNPDTVLLQPIHFICLKRRRLGLVTDNG